MRHRCQNCHFLAKEHVDPQGRRSLFSWDTQERSDLQIKGYYSAKCAQGIWDTGMDPNLNSRLPEILQKERRDTCFFIETQAGMSFPAARDLHKIRNENKNLKKSYRYTQIGLWMVAFGLLLTAFGLLLTALGLILRWLYSILAG